MDITREQLVILKQILKRFPGGYQFLLSLKNADNKEIILALSKKYRVQFVPELVKELNEVFIDGAVELLIGK